MGSYFEQKVVVVTGAASGIGAALGRALAQQGAAAVVLTDVDAAPVARVADELTAGRAGRVEAHALDVRDAAAFAALVGDVIHRHGRVDILFNNAGVAVGGDIEDLSAAHWERVIDVNIRGVVNGVRAVYPHMLERGDGHIVNTASLAGLGPTPLVTPYGMTKHAIVGLSTSLRIEAADRGVRVSVMCPGVIDTPLIDSQGPPDLPALPVRFDARRYLHRLMGAAYPVDSFVTKALAGVARNRAVIIEPARARLVARVTRLAPRVSAKAITRAARAERQALVAETVVDGG